MAWPSSLSETPDLICGFLLLNWRWSKHAGKKKDKKGERVWKREKRKKERGSEGSKALRSKEKKMRAGELKDGAAGRQGGTGPCCWDYLGLRASRQGGFNRP